MVSSWNLAGVRSQNTKDFSSKAGFGSGDERQIKNFICPSFSEMTDCNLVLDNSCL